MKRQQAKGTLNAVLAGYFLEGISSQDSRSNFKGKLESLLNLLSKREKTQLMKRAQFCKEYQRQIDSGKDQRTINGIMARKFQLHRQHIGTYCGYCSFNWSRKKNVR